MSHKSGIGVLVGLLAALGFAAPGTADAFCGFYVGGAEAKLFNDATQVVMMRDGTRTVLAMQNHYEGPAESFAMVVPVPVVLQKENVKTLPREIFEKVDQLTAPRLVEYWERDPCAPEMDRDSDGIPGAYGYKFADDPMATAGYGPHVRVEAQFVVGEYEIVILSTNDAAALDTWLHDNHYKIPDGAEPYLRPYVQQGSKFFVAKVNPAKVKMEHGQAMLSPLRFHYDADTFTLPIRLGLINSAGTQDLIVNILARGQRYEVANYENIAIPTNLDLAPEAKARFGSFYAALFDHTLAGHPHAVVTEYAWDASTCDPCPTPGLDDAEELTLGADVLAHAEGPGFVVTRLHARYAKNAIGADLVFREAKPIEGGRELEAFGAKLSQGAREAEMNNFQARYAIRHAWTGPIACASPVRGIWGEPPDRSAQPGPLAATNIAFAARGPLDLNALVKGPVSDDVRNVLRASPTPVAPRSGGCAGCAVTTADAAAAAAPVAMLVALALVGRRSRRKRA